MTDRSSTLKTFPTDWLEGRYKPWQYAVFGLAIPPFFLTLPFLLFGGNWFFNIPGSGIGSNLLLMALNVASGLGLWRSVTAKYAPGVQRQMAQGGALLATIFLGFLVPGFFYLVVVAVLVNVSNS